MDRVIIGVDPYKRLVTFEARDTREVLRVFGTLPTSRDGYRALLRWPGSGRTASGRSKARAAPAGRWRSGCSPTGSGCWMCRPRPAARARVFDTGQGRTTDAADAHAVVMVALRDGGLRELTTDDELVVLRMLCDRRDELSKARAQGLNRMHRLLAELVPGGVPTKKSVAQYRAMLARVRPRDQHRAHPAAAGC